MCISSRTKIDFHDYASIYMTDSNECVCPITLKVREITKHTQERAVGATSKFVAEGRNLSFKDLG